MKKEDQNKKTRREFIKQATLSSATVTLLPVNKLFANKSHEGFPGGFNAPDSLYHGDQWESLNPGYWQIKGNAIRRRLVNVGDRCRRTGFPYHYKNDGKSMNTSYDPSAPFGMLWRREWYMKGSFGIKAEFVMKGYAEKRPEDDANWKMYQKGFGAFGLAIGAKTLFEAGIRTNASPDKKSIMAVWKDDDTFSLGYHVNNPTEQSAIASDRVSQQLVQGIKIQLSITVTPQEGGKSLVNATLQQIVKGNTIKKTLSGEVEASRAEGYIGLCAQGNVDFEVIRFEVEQGKNKPLNTPLNECHMAYALGDTLRQDKNGTWTCRFISLFRNDGQKAEIRISDAEKPTSGWTNVPLAGSGNIVNNDFRRNTAIIEAKFPGNPADKTFYYTIWKDGKDVTADLRVGTNSIGPGTGMVGDVPAVGSYVGRLPRLKAPYKLCGLSCHAIHGNYTRLPIGDVRKTDGTFDPYFVRDQLTYNCFKHLEDYNFQVMLWEDDVWYMELLQYPLSTDDAYKIVTITLGGPTSRWQMMRHWNVINPGDHDHGMDDTKGPEQLLLRRRNGLGQDPSYMIRNFRIVSHLMIGKENPAGTDNPKRWRKWKMPNKDFTLAICDSRLWRTSQDTDIWDDNGWGEFKNLYSRRDPTRTLLGEEQFNWLTNLIKTDSSRLITLTGINGLHAIWQSGFEKNDDGEANRIAADYAYWVKAGVDRVIDLLGSRSGVTSVYGDVHVGSIVRNRKERIYECSFGPIGRSRGREPYAGWNRQMRDMHGNDLDGVALYQQDHHSPELSKGTEQGEPYYWNFLEMAFDTGPNDPEISLKVRNMVDHPDEKPRGDGHVEKVKASETGRPIASKLPEIKTLALADVQFDRTDGTPIQAIRSLTDGTIPLIGLVEVKPGEKIRMSAFDGKQADAQIIVTKS